MCKNLRKEVIGNATGNGNGNGKGHVLESIDLSITSVSREAVAKQIQQTAEAEPAPTPIFIDIYRNLFKDDDKTHTHKQALKRTLAKIKDVFVDDQLTPTVI